MRWLFLGIASVAACTFPRPPDVADDVPIDAAVDARPDLVTGRSYGIYWEAQGTVEQPYDLSQFTVQALVPSTDSPGGFVTRTGVGRADGTFAIEGVTPGVAYILKLNRSLYVTDQHDITLRKSYLYRSGVAVATAPTPVAVEVPAMPPAEATDQLWMDSVRANTSGTIAAPLAAGQTQVSVSLEWMGAVLPDAAAGDDLTIVQRRVGPATAATGQTTTVVAAATPTPASIIGGTPNHLTATLSSPTSRLNLTTSIGASQYETGHSPLTKMLSLAVECAAQPALTATWNADGGDTAGGAVIISAITDRPRFAALALAGEHPDPFPAAWPRTCAVRSLRARPVRHPSAASSSLLFGGSFRTTIPSSVAAAPLAPPTSIRIDGQDAESGGMIRNDGSPIELTWTGVAQATQYGVVIEQLRSMGAPRAAALIMCPDSRLTVPAELLAGSDYVAFEISAFSVPSAYGDGDLEPDGSPGASATAVTAMFRYSATCGNGTIDLGEDCDGASASCDVDCTAAMCGDGIRNAAAGEICDSIEDTIGCDADCTPNVCGDGHLNVNTEQCDDAGTMSGDGCSATCRTE